MEDFAQIATTLAVEMEAAQRRMEAAQLRMEESQRRRDELLQQMLQAGAVIQADIVRIDETHS